MRRKTQILKKKKSHFSEHFLFFYFSRQLSHLNRLYFSILKVGYSQLIQVHEVSYYTMNLLR